MHFAREPGKPADAEAAKVNQHNGCISIKFALLPCRELQARRSSVPRLAGLQKHFPRESGRPAEATEVNHHHGVLSIRHLPCRDLQPLQLSVSRLVHSPREPGRPAEATEVNHHHGVLSIRHLPCRDLQPLQLSVSRLVHSPRESGRPAEAPQIEHPS